MIPTFCDGQRLIYRPIKAKTSKLKRGYLVIACDPLEPQKLLIKRIHKITSLGIELRGDNSENSVDSRKFGTISPENIKGIIERIIE